MKSLNSIDGKMTRSYNMSQIRSKDTKIEQLIRSRLHKDGFRFFKNYKLLKGSPDIVLKKYSAVVFVNGCFWHGHDNCKYFKTPKTNTTFWESKILTNTKRDKANVNHLLNNGWRVCILWECAIRNKPSCEISELIKRLENWLQQSAAFIELND